MSNTPDISEKKFNISNLIKFPCRFDEFGGGYIWDADENMIAQASARS